MFQSRRLPEDLDHSILWAVVEACTKTLQRQYSEESGTMEGMVSRRVAQAVMKVDWSVSGCVTRNVHSDETVA
ncbi:MAG TPA: hypothetical protein DDY39_10545 [Nitrospira sp.]|nr:hypothetical protein [Nitrospira sp.]HBR49999.1 hypothetical protein [Nitrospira sp.]